MPLHFGFLVGKLFDFHFEAEMKVRINTTSEWSYKGATNCGKQQRSPLDPSVCMTQVKGHLRWRVSGRVVVIEGRRHWCRQAC